MEGLSLLPINTDLKDADLPIALLIEKEKTRQESHLELIASENFASKAVMQAQSSVLTNKYAEGLPHKRYYGGCEHVDAIEELAIQRAKQLFKATWVNVQPHSGAQANFAVFLALLNPGDTIMGMDLSHGGSQTNSRSTSLTSLRSIILSLTSFGKLSATGQFGVVNVIFILTLLFFSILIS